MNNWPKHHERTQRQTNKLRSFAYKILAGLFCFFLIIIFIYHLTFLLLREAVEFFGVDEAYSGSNLQEFLYRHGIQDTCRSNYSGIEIGKFAWKTSAMVGAWECNVLFFRYMTDRSTNQRTDIRAQRVITKPIIDGTQ